MKNLKSYQIANESVFSLNEPALQRMVDSLDLTTFALADAYSTYLELEEYQDSKNDLFTQLGNIFKP